MKKIKAWYFSEDDCKLRFGDGRLIVAGETHTVECKPVLCEAGLHGSVKPLDALQYAPGPMVWRVELSGEMDIGEDKIAATERKYLWGYDATDVLRAFARRCALDVIHLWAAPEVVIRYLKTGDESRRDAARAAASDASWAAASDAARAAASDAARDAARDAAWDAVWDASRAAARRKQNNRLQKLLMAGRGVNDHSGNLN